MKTSVSMIATVLCAITLISSPGRAADIRVVSGSYGFSGSAPIYSTAGHSQMYRNGLGRGSYQAGRVTATLSNHSYNRSGTVVLNLWVSSYIGATTGMVIYSKGWGGNASNVFNARQTWTCTKPGHRKILNRYGYGALAAHEYNGSWPMRHEVYDTSSYRKW